jgi:nucleotide-binding universal stress UspA family protein
MVEFKNILVDVDAGAEWHPALDQAIELARYSGARLRIVDVVRPATDVGVVVPPGVETLWTDRRHQRLEEFARAAGELQVECETLTGRRPALRLVEEVLRRGHDLLVRSHARDLAQPHPKGHGAIDMQLFRKCPCPVWTVGPGLRQRPQRIVAAVNASPNDPEEQRLNVKILESALRLARADATRVTVLQAWEPFGEQLLRGRYSQQDLHAYVEDSRRAASAALDALVATLGRPLQGAAIELLKGHPEHVVPLYVNDHGIDLVVMGTVARTGVPGLLMGNTAERMLQKLWCSILAVKPEGFQTPVTLQNAR